MGRVAVTRSLPAPHMVAEMGLPINTLPHTFVLSDKLLGRDYAAVRAGVRLEWSNGPVEGEINRLKQLKRQMYGRAKLDLLRQRVLAA
jgi:transposase